MIEGDSYDERKRRVYLVLGNQQNSDVDSASRCWNCRVYHWDSRTEFIEAT